MLVTQAGQGRHRQLARNQVRLGSERRFELLRRAWHRIRRYGLLSHVLGWWLGQKLAQSGVLLVIGGWPLPCVQNRGGRIEVENCALFAGVRLECWQDAQIRIGKGTYLNRNAEIVAAQSVTIGHDCKIARDVIIMDTDQHALPGEPLVARPVAIGDRVWIGARAIVLKGVTIGDDAVVGAGTVVTHDVPPRTLVAGVPARVVRQL
jgi:acetyltransferase-like isoleucine patch superfamily enzyme